MQTTLQGYEIRLTNTEQQLLKHMKSTQSTLAEC